MSSSSSIHRLFGVRVIGCTNLKDTHLISRQDLYVCLEYGGTKYRTRMCIDDGKNPKVQDHKLVFPLVEGHRELHFTVWNSNSNSNTRDDFIGRGKVQLEEFISRGYKVSAWPLETETGRNAVEVVLELRDANAANLQEPAASRHVSAPLHYYSPPYPLPPPSPAHAASCPPPPAYAASYPPPPAYAASYPPPPEYAASYPPPPAYAASYPPPPVYAASYPPPPVYAASYPPPPAHAASCPPPAAWAAYYPPHANTYPSYPFGYPQPSSPPTTTYPLPPPPLPSQAPPPTHYHQGNEPGSRLNYLLQLASLFGLGLNIFDLVG